MDRLSLFATPVVVMDVPGMEEHNRELSDRLLAEQQRSRGFQRSNVGGWHSVPDLSQRREPCYQALIQAIIGCVGDTAASLAASGHLPPAPRYRYGVTAWAMIMRDGDYTILHDHGDAHWSSAYYVDAGDFEGEGPSGLLAFESPRRGGRPIPGMDLFPSTFSVEPRTSMLVLFPGWLQHYVHSYRGKRPRISISANVVMDPMPPGQG